MNFGQVVREPLGLLRGQSRFLRPNTLLSCTIHADAGVGESSICESEIGVLVNGLFEQPHGLAIGVLGVTVAQGVASLQVEVIGLHVLGGMGADTGLLFVGQLEGKGGGHVAVDLVFEGEQIARGSGELLAPDALAGGGIVEVEGDAELVAIALHHALQHQVDA